MPARGPAPSVVFVVTCCAMVVALLLQAMWNWISRGSPALTGDDIARTGLLCAVIVPAALFAAPRGR